jgi:hypothetical protein
MPILQTTILFGFIAIVFDAIWATIARAKNYSYTKGMWISFLIYTLAGAVAAQSGNIIIGVLSGSCVAFIEATTGWWISWLIGPGRLPDTITKEVLPRAILMAITNVTLIGEA